MLRLILVSVAMIKIYLLGVLSSAAIVHNSKDFFEGELFQLALPSNKRKDVVYVTADEHPRPDTTLEQLARLKGVVSVNGCVTAGNASGLNDGACALLLASDAALQRYGLTPRARALWAVR